MPTTPVKKIAVIGSGISGLTSAYLLAQQHDVSVFEANAEIGGHTATKTVVIDERDYAIDTGFIVFNDRTYPNFIKLMDQLGVVSQATDMGFSVSCRQRKFEYSGTSFNGLFAQRPNLFSLSYWKMLREIIRFNRACTELYNGGAIPKDKTLQAYLVENSYSLKFCELYIYPMVSAIWSSSLSISASMPLTFFINFFHNHGLLTVTQQPQWYTIKGGSKTYLLPLTHNFANKIYTSTAIRSVKRVLGGVVLTSDVFGDQHFDEVIFACHSDQALALLADASVDESAILSAIPYAKNSVSLHTDTKLLPNQQRAWASWNYLLLDAITNLEDSSNKEQGGAVLTYNMNILQAITAPVTFCVSVNATQEIDPQKLLGNYQYDHPMFTLESVAAQARWPEISGKNHTHYCGAYWRNGFHEDGVVSGIRVAEVLGARF